MQSQHYVTNFMISYKTQYTVLKAADSQTVDALPNLATEPQAQVYWYHDIYVNPSALVSDIPCDSLAKTQKRQGAVWIA